MQTSFDKNKTLAMVKGIAIRIKMCGCPMEFNALVSEGWIGAVQAWEVYNSDNPNGASYYSFAQYRVRGAMFDALRMYDGLPSRSPIKRFFMSMDEPYVFCDDYQEGTKLTLHDILSDKSESVLDRLEREDLLKRVNNIINNGALGKIEKSVILLYIKGLYLREIGGIMGFSESRASQVRTSAIKKIRKELRGLR